MVAVQKYYDTDCLRAFTLGHPGLKHMVCMCVCGEGGGGDQAQIYDWPSDHPKFLATPLMH